MISFNSPNKSLKSHTGILINRHVSVQAAADVTCHTCDECGVPK
jgi:hypothetical protein